MDKTSETTPTTEPSERRERPSKAPRMLGRYRVQGVLGSGGMGTVYAAFDDRLWRRVAIKQLRQRNHDEVVRRRFVREAQILARLPHPNIVAVYEWFEVDGQLAIVMEYVEGRTLRDWIAETQPTHADILAVLREAGHGIVAAHEAGLIHRDLKPDNIMVGDDGRVRVMDFGLARGLDLGDDEPALGGRSLAERGFTSSLTSTGAVLGTPGYAAPEQLLGLGVDVRADVFGFCVLAYESIHGGRPFVGRDAEAVRRATLEGRIRTIEGSHAPAWLDAVLRRGLRVEPDARWPSMSALLDALGRDPVLRRRRRLAALAALVLIVVVIVASIELLSRLRDVRAQTEREAAAAARLRAVEAAIAEAETAGHPAEAEAAFRAFVSDPAHQRTRALSSAWIGRGDRSWPALEPTRAAYAEAYVTATTVDDERRALLRLAEAFHRARDGEALTGSVALLRERGATGLAELAFDGALWSGDLDAALAELATPGHPDASWRPLLEPLTYGRSLGLDSFNATAFGSGPGARLAVVEHLSNALVLFDAQLREVGRSREAETVELIAGWPWALLQTGERAWLVDLQTDETLATGDADIFYALAFDASGDGRAELLLGRAWPRYGFERWDGIGRGPTRARAAHPETDASDSSIDAHAVGDLDGDGVEELALGFGPWHRFELRLFGPHGDGELELLAVRRLGRIGALAVVEHDEQPLLIAVTDNSSPEPELFPDPPHTGDLAVFVFAWTGDELVECERIPIPGADRLGRFVVNDFETTGDLDGDGREDLAIRISAGGEARTLVLRQTEAGFEPLMIYGLWPLATMQLDDDPALELVVRRCVAGPQFELAALGLGQARLRLQPNPSVDAVPPAPATLVDPLLAERWRRAGDLEQLGLDDSAATALREAATQTEDLQAKGLLLDRAASLLEQQRRWPELLAVDRHAYVDATLRTRARARRLQALRQLGRYEDALGEAEMLLRDLGSTREQQALARASIAELSALLDDDAQIDLRFDVPLATSWQLRRPGAVRRAPARAVLELSLAASEGPAAVLPIAWSGGPLTLELEFDVELEFGACVEFALVDGSDRRWLGTRYCGQGGGGALGHLNSFSIPGFPALELRSDPIASARERRRVRVQLAYFPTRARVEAVFDDGQRYFQSARAQSVPAVGPQYLVITGSSAASLARAELHHVRIRGAGLVEPTPAELARFEPARRLAEHEPLAALRALELASPPPDHAATLRVLAFAELDDLGRVREAVGELLPRLDDPTWLGDLVLIVREYPVAGAALRERTGPRLLPTLAKLLAHAHEHRNDAPVRDELLAELRDVERLTPATPEQAEALRELLRLRAELWEHSGASERATADRRSRP